MSDLESFIQYGFQHFPEVPIRRVSGVYFLCDEQAVVYVGQSKNVPARIASHISQGAKLFSRAFYIPLPSESLSIVEDSFIQTLRPQYNKGRHINRVKKTRATAP